MSTRITGGSKPKARRRLEPRKKPVQRRSKVTVEQILIAAAQVFEAHGYAAGTANRIAERADVSVGTLYQYFPSKEAVAVALLEEHIKDTYEKAAVKVFFLLPLWSLDLSPVGREPCAPDYPGDKSAGRPAACGGCLKRQGKT